MTRYTEADLGGSKDFTPEELDAIQRKGELSDPPPPPEEIEMVPLADFVAEDEPGAAALLGDDDDALIPENGDVMIYGDGGAGKTTLSIDLACHLAVGRDWLGISVPNPVRVLLVENEGPRPMFRRKLRRKLDAWGAPLDNIRVFERPWGQFSFAYDAWREELALRVMAFEIDVIVAGPLTRVGMHEAGTLQDVVAFMRLVTDLRSRSARPLTVVLIHHENKAGTVSGAWEGSGDTLLHVQSAGNGHTTVVIKKARWASTLHGKTLKLTWTEGEGFEPEGDRDLDAEVVQLLSERGWLTVKEICAPTGIGAREPAVKDILGDPERFESKTGLDAKVLGRSPNATIWNVRRASVAPVAESLFSATPRCGQEGTATCDRPIGVAGPDAGAPPLSEPEPELRPEAVADPVSSPPQDPDQERAEQLMQRWGDALDNETSEGRAAAREEDR